MYTKLLLVGILISGTAFGQNSEEPLKISSHARTITIQHQTSIDYVPDEIEMNIVLLEYVKTDPETQQTSTIEIEEIEKQLLEKIKLYGLGKSDLALTDINDQVQATANNGYGYAVPNSYTTTQKRLIRKTYSIIWTRPTEDLQPFMESLRFSGIQSMYLQTGISSSKTLEIQEKLLKKLMSESKEQAKLIATSTKKSVGEVVSCNINPPQMGSNSSEAMYPNYTNYNNFYGSNNGKLNKGRMSMSISVLYELN